MAFRNPTGTPVGFGMMPYHQQMYMPGNLSMSLQQQQQQQQQPRPGGSQFAPTRASFPGMAPQRYPVVPQGITPQQGGYQPQMYTSQQGVAMQQQIPFQQQQQQVFAGQPHMPQQQQPRAQRASHQRPVAGQPMKNNDQVKKERYFHEQQRKLKQFSKVGARAASVDSLSINLDEMFGKGAAGRGAGANEANRGRTREGGADGGPQKKMAKETSPAVEDDGFGDFHQGPTPPVNTPQTPEARPVPSQGQQTSAGPSHPSPKDEGFGDFLQGQGLDGGKDTGPIGAKSKPLKDARKVLSLESMMLSSADLTAPSKPARPKKAMGEGKLPTQAHRPRAFAPMPGAKAWSSAENVSSSLFSPSDAPAASGVGPAKQGPKLQAGRSIASPQGGDGKGVPAWCLNESNLPIVYHQVLEASIRDGRIETNLIYPILMLSGLDKPVLRHIWEVANQTLPGQLTRLELYMVLGLIALAQNGQQPTIEALQLLREAPLPSLTPKAQSGPQTDNEAPARPAGQPPVPRDDGAGVAEAERKEDDFAPFQEAPGHNSSEKHGQESSEASTPTPGISLPPAADHDNHADPLDRARDKHCMDSSLNFPKEEENCYIFAGSPADSSSGRSSPLVWDPNSIYDKLTCRSQESVSSGSLSDHTPNEEDDEDGDDEFHDFKVAPKLSKTPKASLLASFPSIAPPKSQSSGSLSSSLAASKQGKFAVSTVRSFDSLSQRKGAGHSREDQQKIDLFQMDFEKVFPKVGKKSTTTDDFGNFQAGAGTVSGTAAQGGDEFGNFTHFKHSASESDLMGMQPAQGDKYAAFRDLSGGAPQAPDVQAEEDDDFDDFKQAGPTQTNSSVPAALTSSDSFADITESAQQAPLPGFTANFQDAYPSEPPNNPQSIFEPSPTLPTINLSASLPDEEEEEGFADFKQAAPMPPSAGNPASSIFNLKYDSASTSSSEDKYSSLRVLGGSEDREPPEDDFGDFQTNPQPPAVASLAGRPGFESVQGEMKKPVSASDLYGMEFDALGSVNSGSGAMLNLEDAAETEPTDDFEPAAEPPFSAVPNSFQTSQNSKLSKLESIDRLDLKTFDLDLTLGRSDAKEGKDRGDSFGEFSSAPADLTTPVGNADQDLSPAGPVVLPQGVSSVPLMPCGSSLMGDRYSEVVGNVDNENRHANEWQRCLEKCHEAVRKANNMFNNISSSSVCSEVIKSSEGSEYLSAVIEIYRVACRIVTSMNAMGVDTAELQKLQKDIELVWTNLSAFLASSTLMPAAGSFVFKTAVLRPEPTNTDRACGVCLLNVNSRSKAFDRARDNHKLVYGGRQYHATCANLWVNMVDSILPALPLNKLL